MRHNGLIVDSTAEKHVGIDGLPGTQSFYSGNRDIQFRLNQRAGLMSIPHREPTAAEIQTLPQFILTADEPWCPCCHEDDKDTTTPLTDHPFDSVAAYVERDNNVTSGSAARLNEQTDQAVAVPVAQDANTTTVHESDLTAQAVAAHAYKDDETSTIITNFEPDHSPTPVELPPGFEIPIKQNNPIPPYRQAAKILDQYSIENDKMALAMSLDDPWQDIPLVYEGPERRIFSCAMESETEFLVHNIQTTISNAFFVSMDDQRCVTKEAPENEVLSDDTSPTIVSRAYNMDGTINDFLHSLSDRELLGYNEPFDAFAYHTEDCIRHVHAHFMHTKAQALDAAKYQQYLGFRPLEVIRHTLENTIASALTSLISLLESETYQRNSCHGHILLKQRRRFWGQMCANILRTYFALYEYIFITNRSRWSSGVRGLCKI